MATSEVQASIERELWETRVALAEARAFIARTVDNDGQVSSEAITAFRNWLDAHPFNPEASLESIRRNQAVVQEEGNDRER